jgi:hypothetical protein
MIAIIQCAASKQEGAGRLSTADGRPVKFVADPDAAPPDDRVVFAHPDDASDRGMSWREVLLEYNKTLNNPLKLLKAWELYDDPAYGRLVRKCGVANVYVLSAGWGLIHADFLTPDYDITFSYVKPKQRYKRRGRDGRYHDFCMLPQETREPILFFGGKGYLPLLALLTSSVRAPKTVFYNSGEVPEMPGWTLKRFETRTRTNWHYECVNAFVDGETAHSTTFP